MLSMRRDNHQQPILIAGTALLVGIYLILAFAALFCGTAHMAHEGHVPHNSALCTWACQANNATSSLISLENLALPILLFTSLIAFSFYQFPNYKFSHLPSRSPPR